MGFLRQLLFVTVLKWLRADVAKADERIAFAHFFSNVEPLVSVAFFA